MKIPNLALASDSAAAPGTVVLFVQAGEAPTLLSANDHGFTSERLAALEAKGKAGSTTRVLVANDADERPALLVGIGTDRTPEALRRAAGVAARALRGANEVVLDLETADADEVEALALGFALGGHRLDAYLTGAGDDAEQETAESNDVRTVAVVGAGDEAEAAIARARALAEAVAFARDLGNTPPNDLPPAEFAERAVAAVDGLPVEIEVWDETRLAEERCGGILGVGAGSSRPPRLVRLDYAPEGAAAHLALVGKGITFDTGGISLKPSGSMTGMKFDMSGAGNVLAAIIAIARLGLPVRVTGFCCLAENMPSGTSIRPDDILTMRNGTTVEVTNTDAEGRLVLADGLVLASELQPDLVVDVATLTGAAMVALGMRTTAVFGNSDEWRERVLAAAGTAGEVMWPMPIPEEFPEQLDSTVADLINANLKSRWGGALLAGAFLEKFVGKGADGEPLPWLHLDIAGPADNSGAPYGYVPKGASGIPVRTLVELAASVSAAA